ncbi:MAG: MazG family protein [Lachnospiraceae bacterium]|nr:MazG family protein [Lachnospiraceae bacterium]
MDKRHTFKDFVEIIRALRAENGCPWDREQTHTSLKPCMTEEAAELLAAIRIYEKSGDAENMREELGDILLQVVMHSVIAEEEGIFTIEDVIEEVSQKMIRRHPHVFGSVQADNADQVLVNWEEIKKKEKEGKSWIKSPLREIPQELPALARACKALKKADKLYGLPEGEETLGVRLETAFTELKEADAAHKKDELEKRYTEMLWLLCELAYRRKLSPEQMLSDLTAESIEVFEPESE